MRYRRTRHAVGAGNGHQALTSALSAAAAPFKARQTLILETLKAAAISASPFPSRRIFRTVSTGTDLVEQELSPYSGGGRTRTRIDGPSIMLSPNLAQAMAIALHELATNAAKYGALSVPEGNVRVEWALAADRHLVLRWTEAGGPPVKPPTRSGFGTKVMATMIRDRMDGKVRLDWRAEGLAREITIPT